MAKRKPKPLIPQATDYITRRDAFRMLPGRITKAGMFVLVNGTWYPEREIRAAMKPPTNVSFMALRETMDSRSNWINH